MKLTNPGMSHLIWEFNPFQPMYIEEDGGEPGNQPTATSTFMLTADAGDQARDAQLSSLLTQMQGTGYSSFTDKAQARFDLI